MKRSPMPRRSTSLPRYGSRVRSVSSKRAAKAGEYAHLRALVHAREGGNCARCGNPAPITTGECHHRLTRARLGKDTAQNCVWLCFTCHHPGIHDNPDQAGVTAQGWLVPSGVDPADWPVWRTHYGTTGFFQPDEFGWTRAEPREEQTGGANVVGTQRDLCDNGGRKTAPGVASTNTEGLANLPRYRKEA